MRQFRQLVPTATDIGINYGNWDRNDTWPRPDTDIGVFPNYVAQTGLKAAVAQLNSLGVRNVAYINGRDFNMQASVWPLFRQAACDAYVGEQDNCTLTPDPNISCRGSAVGPDPPSCKSNQSCTHTVAPEPTAAIVSTPRRELWGDFTAVMNPAHPKWRELVVNQSLELFQYGMDGVYIDQASSFPPQPCMNQRGHGVGASWVEGNRAVFDAIRQQAAPKNVVLMSESNADVLLDGVDVNLALYGWLACGNVPAFQAVYSGYTINVGLLGFPSSLNGTADKHNFAFLLGWQLIYGHIPGGAFNVAGYLLSLRDTRNLDVLNFLRAVARAREELADTLVHGKMLRPLRMLGQPLNTTVVSTVPDGYACGVPVVLSSSWEAANGSVVVLAVNPGNTTQLFYVVALGLGRIVALYYRSSTLYHIH
jgi:hypothetical protein